MAEEINPNVGRGSHPERHGQNAAKPEGNKSDGKTREEVKRQETGDKKQETRNERQREAEEVAKEAKRRIDEAKAKGKQAKIFYKDKGVKDLLGVVSGLQDEKEVIINPDELKDFKNLLIKYGYLKASEIRKLTPEQVVVVFQVVAREVGFEKLKKEDFVYTDKENRKSEKRMVEILIKQAESFGEETLTVDKVGQYLDVEEFDKKVADTEEGGPGTMAGAAGVRGVPPRSYVSFKILLQEMLDNFPDRRAPHYRNIRRELEDRVHSSDPELIYDAVQGLRELQAARAYDPGLRAQIENVDVLPPDLQTELIEVKQAIDDEYTILLDQLTPEGRLAMIRDIDDEGERAASSLQYGYFSPEDVANFLLAQIEDPARSALYPEQPGYEGLRKWYAVKKAEQVRTTHEINRRSRVSVDPVENIKSSYETMKFFEKSRSIEGFDLARQRLSLLLDAVENSRDTRVDQATKKRLRAHIEAFERITPLFIVMYRDEGEPERMQQVMGNIEDMTFFDFYDRFTTVRDSDESPYLLDRQGRMIYMDLEGHHFFKEVDLAGNETFYDQANRVVAVDATKLSPLNLLSEAENSFIFQYMTERFRMNKVQEMTRRDLDINSGNADEQWIIKKILGLPQHLALPHLTLAQINQLRDAWNDTALTGQKVNVVKAWYNEITLIGVDDFEGVQERRDVREEEVVQSVLRRRLEDKGVDPSRIDALFLDQELLPAIKSIAANMTRFKLSSSLDRLRVYDKHGEMINSVFGEETPFFARETDNMPDFFLSEVHGDARVNRVIRNLLNRKCRSFMLPSNQIIYRVLSNAMSKDLLSGDMNAKITREIKAETDRTGTPDDRKPEVDGYVTMDMIFEGFEENPTGSRNPNELRLFDINWAESSKAIDHYLLNDNANDRTQTVRWLRNEFKAFNFKPYSEGAFFEMMTRYYSTRHLRKKQAAEIFLEAFWEVGHHWKDWYFLKDNIANSQMESIINNNIGENMLDHARAEKLKGKLIGKPVTRIIKQSGEFLFASAQELMKPGYIFGSLLDFFKTLAVYLGQTWK